MSKGGLFVRCCLVAIALVAVAGGVSAQSNPRSLQITPEHIRFDNYLQDLAGPGAFIRVIGGGLVDGLRHKADAESVTQRIGTRAAQAAVQVSVRHGLAALLHRSTDYGPCECSGVGRKMEHALLETFTDRRTDGSRALSIPRLAGSYAGSLAELAWNRDKGVGDAALGATISLGFTAMFNVARELTGLAR